MRRLPADDGSAFAPAAALASRLLGFAVNAKWMERMAKRLGSEMAAADASAEDAEDAPADAMCCGINGTGVPVRLARRVCDVFMHGHTGVGLRARRRNSVLGARASRPHSFTGVHPCAGETLALPGSPPPSGVDAAALRDPR